MQDKPKIRKGCTKRDISKTCRTSNCEVSQIFS